MNVLENSRKLIATAAIGLFAAGAVQADPTEWTVDPSGTRLTVSLSALGIANGSGSASATGTQLSDFDPLNNTIEALPGGSILFGDITLSGFLLTGSITGLSLVLTGGPVDIEGGVADLGGFYLDLPTGIISIGLLGAPVDLADYGLSAQLPGTASTLNFLGSTSNAQYTYDDYGWLIPINFSDTQNVSGFDVNINMVGQVALLTTVATPVPEPGTLGLLASGLAGFAALRRRSRR